MAVFILPDFITDLQHHGDPNFAKRVLQKTLDGKGNFKADANDHRHDDIEDAWIRYVSRGRTAYRVIYIRKGENIYLYRAGEHAIEDRIAAPEIDPATGIAIAAGAIAGELVPARDGAERTGKTDGLVIDRLYTNIPPQQIYRKILARRNIPHTDIWFVSPFINPDILKPGSPIGDLLFAQMEDGADVSIFTTPPKDQNLEWMESTEARGVKIYVYPRLHTKLYAFVFDEVRRYDPSLRGSNQLESIALIGSSNLTFNGLALNNAKCNEELCYVVPSNEITHIETYVTRLILGAYDLPFIRMSKARGMWNKLENPKWS